MFWKGLRKTLGLPNTWSDGDITTQAGVNSSNIDIVDMDGAYAPDSAVIEDAEAVKPVYSVTEIRTANPDGII